MRPWSAFAAAVLAGSMAAVAIGDELQLVAPDFTVTVTSGPLAAAQGRSAASTVTTAVSGGFNAAVALSASGLPSGASATFAPTSLPAPGAGTATITVAAGAATPSGSFTITVTGSGGGLTRSTTVTLMVTATTVQIFADGFEGSLSPDWELWHRPGAASAWWGKSTYRKAAGSYSVYCAGSGAAAPPAGGPYPANMEGWMIYGPFSLVDATGALVSFKYWMNNHDANDKLQYFVSLNDSAYWGMETAQQALTWQTINFDLGDPHLQVHPLGQPQVWLALIFISDGSGQSEGAYVDSLAITKTVAAPVCAVTCAATVPTQAAPGSPVAFTGTLGAGNCTGQPAVSWNFGDGTPLSGQPAPTHTYQSPGTYGWSMVASMGGATCSKNGSIMVTAPPECSLSCSATVPAAGSRQWPVAFHASATATDCASPPAYVWNFDDGTLATTADAQHTYAARGSYHWTLTVTAGSRTCTKTGTLSVGERVHRHLSGEH
jgi:PKD repeat protein